MGQSPASWMCNLLQNVFLYTLTFSIMRLRSECESQLGDGAHSLEAELISSQILNCCGFCRKCPPPPSPSLPSSSSSLLFSPFVFPSSQLGLKLAEFRGETEEEGEIRNRERERRRARLSKHPGS